LVTVTT